ncbi:M48 family metalloprotease [Candidatus Woesearchaeota archaeon]|nr:M48 family metalloprotease [Candidatus Woesearchaeota archaeon]
MAMCYECVNTFIDKPVNQLVVMLSIVIALLLLGLFLILRKQLRNAEKLGLLYSFVFFMVFPFAYYLYARTCQKILLSCQMAQSLVSSGVVAIVVTILLSFVVVPFIYMLSSRSKSITQENVLFRKMERHARKMGIKTPSVYLLDKAEPYAFSISHIHPSIFLTMGIVELLKPKELDAVLLHELAHIQQKSSPLKFTNTLFRLFTPISNFNILYSELNEEEKDADAVAVRMQNTERHLLSAKQKVSEYQKQAAI